jgi:hypothetical protein
MSRPNSYPGTLKYCVVDAIRGLQYQEHNNWRTDQMLRNNMVLAGEDPVAVDALAASLMGFDPWDMEFLHLAQARGMGSMDSTRADAHRKAHLWMGVRGRASAWLNGRKVAGGENRTRYRVPGALIVDPRGNLSI